ncbi:tryptophan synthase subunit alpha [Helicobacter sp. 11S02596-1]|uniref:tryptophan synthase subunit alpha n=1 Tax=Helicobacter sp. 11S02596-1 TaxID=1476194 RepID=UPI000BA59901|nr:tryptophan synthase subunit alpha [Helicobacter sp. 11S02596-1]PAF45036.1 tryptophan synthase subunit alpha [Helicobacter sp. 11S02596-1]
MKNIQLMGHIIAGYPNKASSIEAGLGICNGGADFLEIQFPFSDPSADGPIIQNACNVSLEDGFKIQDGFDIASTLAQNTQTQILLMTYANIVFVYGVENFVIKAKACGIKALIIPDLPFECDENLRKIAKKYGVDVIELITPGMDAKRIAKLSKTRSDFVYVVARSGTTGKKTEMEASLFEWIDFVKKHSNKKIALGFGIRSNDQIQALKNHVDIIVAGSYFVEKITDEIRSKPQTKDLSSALKHATQTLMGK